MKKTFLLMLALMLSQPSWAGPTVQRTPDSSYDDYKKYLSQNQGTSFVDSYIQISSFTEMDTPLLEKCLEEVYVGAPAASTCLTAVKSLTSKPLNQARREVLYSFLIKLEKVKSPQKSFYLDLKNGLLRTHQHLTKTFNVSAPAGESVSNVQELEMKAWKKALARKFPLEEVALLINGKRVTKLEKWSAPQGVYQWSLLTNTHEPFIRLGTFSQFAAESLKELKPLASADCKDLQDLDVQKFGLMQVDVFSNSKCVAHFGMAPKLASSEHLGNSSSMVNMEKSSSRHWIWPVLAVVAVGAAAALKDKQVSVEMPSFH